VDQRDSLRGYFSFGERTFTERLNLDGFLRQSGSKGMASAQIQWFRCGGVELFWEEGLSRLNTSTEQLGINGAHFSFCSVEYTKLAIGAMSSVLRLAPPFVAMLSIMGLSGLGIRVIGELVPDRFWEPAINEFTDHELVMPPVLLDSANADVEAELRPILDAIWQAAGLARCLLYSRDGEWEGRKLHGASRYL